MIKIVSEISVYRCAEAEWLTARTFSFSYSYGFMFLKLINDTVSCKLYIDELINSILFMIKCQLLEINSVPYSLK